MPAKVQEMNHSNTNATLRLDPFRATNTQRCESCGGAIRPDDTCYRCEENPLVGSPSSSCWCRGCVDRRANIRDGFGRIWIRKRRFEYSTSCDSIDSSGSDGRGVNLKLYQTKIVGIGRPLAERLSEQPELIHRITPEQFEEFICDRLCLMGFEPKQVGKTNNPDGGIDIIFWPRIKLGISFFGAVQCKHHRNPEHREGPAAVRDFAGAIATHQFGAALLVTNTTFTPQAAWFAKQQAKLIQLRDFRDIRRWLQDNLFDDEEWREIPSQIELCPGVVVTIT